ncbi:hypothetical protein [Xanthomonas phaseoli]
MQSRFSPEASPAMLLLFANLIPRHFPADMSPVKRLAGEMDGFA